MYREDFEKKYRNLIVGVNTKIPLGNGKLVTAINFDNAATTPPFISVLQEITSFAPWYSSINRGKGYKSEFSTEVYDNSRKAVLDFVKGNIKTDTVIYVKNTTEGINKLAHKLCTNTEECVILSTSMEHHSNDLPWRDKYTIDYIDVDQNGRLSLKDLEKKLVQYKGNVKLVTISGASNVTGYINPIYTIASLAHKYDAKILVDGAQLIPHIPMNMKSSNAQDHIDFLVFSGHKMYAPFGIGVLIGPKEAFEEGPPDQPGGGTVQLVTHDSVTWNDPPAKEEAGSPNLMGVVALISAIKTLNSIGMKDIELYEKYLTDYTLYKMRDIPDIQIYGNNHDSSDRLGIISFNIHGLHHNSIAEILSYERGISVRTGCFCAQPYVQTLLKIPTEKVEAFKDKPKELRPGMVRVSFGMYNTTHEIDILIKALYHIVENKRYYMKKYNPRLSE